MAGSLGAAGHHVPDNPIAARNTSRWPTGGGSLTRDEPPNGRGPEAEVIHGTSGPSATAEADLLRETERARLRALVAHDVKDAEQPHAHDFQFISPGAGAASNAGYLGGIASGSRDDRVWEPESLIDVPAELRRRLRQHFSEGQLVELAATFAWENFRARFNRAFGVRPVGYCAGGFCVLPEARRHRTASMPAP
jgi:hypothetical protein